MGYSNDIENALGGSGIAMEYESKLFDTSEIISINIIMDEKQWDDMISIMQLLKYIIHVM